MTNNLKEKRIAVIGVSQRQEKWGFKIFCDLLTAGYLVEGVNPANGEVLGKTIFRNLAEISPPPELVITVVPAAVTEQVVEECKKLEINEIWMQPGSESKQAIEKARQYGLSVTTGACFMVAKGLW